MVRRLIAMKLILLLFFGTLDAQNLPANFLLGTASSAYQIEGAWNRSGKGENIWDSYTHNHPERIADRNDADVSADSYHNLERDVSLLRHLGVDFYVFSLSWSRILPTGFPHQINPDGVDYYKLLIEMLLKNGIIPVVALFEWDTPKGLEDLGGFSNPAVADWFEDYAKVAFENFGNVVRYWLSFNNPGVMCLRGYGGAGGPPGYNSSGIGDYLCGHNVLRAHARVYHLYDQIYRGMYRGKLGIGLGSHWYEPATPDDTQAAQKSLDFSLGWFADPVHFGSYPKTMQTEIETNSLRENFTSSRLPQFEKEEEQIAGSYDFFFLNFKGGKVVESAGEEDFSDVSYGKDRGVKIVRGSESSRGLTKILKHIHRKYQNPKVFVTGSGVEDEGGLNDTSRIKHIQDDLRGILGVIEEDGADINGYAVWSFLDSFEWEKRYTVKYGLHHVNFTSPSRTRTPRMSAKYMQELAIIRRLEETGKGGASYFTPGTVTVLSAAIFVILY